MKLPSFPFLTMACMAGFVISACDQKPAETTADASAPEKPVVLTTFYPTQYFAERIGQDLIDVRCPLPEGADPIHWMPDAEALQAYQSGDLVVINGAEFEQWVGKVSLPTSKVVNTAAGFEDQFVRYEHAVRHKHGPEGEHSHEGIDGHTWVDPVNAVAQAEALAAALTKLRPDQEGAVAGGMASLKEDLLALDARWRAFAQAWGDRPLFASHPAYNYIASRYDLQILSFDFDPDEVPDHDALHEVEHELEDAEATLMLWESEPKPEVAAALAKLGFTNITVSPCESAPEDGDYLSVMQEGLARLEAQL